MAISLRHTFIALVSAVACASLATAHIRIAPTESAPGAREKYTMRVPNEKQVNTIRVEGEFPAGLQIYDFEFKPGWKIDFKKDESGKIIGATWTGKVAAVRICRIRNAGHQSEGRNQLGLEVRAVLRGRHEGRIYWTRGIISAFAGYGSQEAGFRSERIEVSAACQRATAASGVLD